MKVVQALQQGSLTQSAGLEPRSARNQRKQLTFCSEAGRCTRGQHSSRGSACSENGAAAAAAAHVVGHALAPPRLHHEVAGQGLHAKPWGTTTAGSQQHTWDGKQGPLLGSPQTPLRSQARAPGRVCSSRQAPAEVRGPTCIGAGSSGRSAMERSSGSPGTICQWSKTDRQKAWPCSKPRGGGGRSRQVWGVCGSWSWACRSRRASAQQRWRGKHSRACL